jgi:hypothetical protein
MSALVFARACLGSEHGGARCQRLRGQVHPPAAQENSTETELWRSLLEKCILPRRASMQEKHWKYYPDVTTSIALQFPEAKQQAPGRPIRVLEVGTMFGGLAEHLLSALPGIEMYVVDPFLAGYDWRDQMSNVYWQVTRAINGSASVLSGAWALAMAHDLSSRHGCRYRLFHERSLDAVRRFEAHQLFFDVAFIDGLHTFEGVVADLAAYWPRVSKERGILIGNDFKYKWFPGVQKAFKSFAAQHPEIEMLEGRRAVAPGEGNVLLRRKDRTRSTALGL